MGQRARVEDRRASRSIARCCKDVNRFRTARRPAAVRGPDARRLAVASAQPARVEPGVSRSAPADWPAWHQLCGFLELPSHEHEALSPEVEAFLASGAGAGVHGIRQPDADRGQRISTDTVDVFEEAARIAGCRAIIQAEIDRTRAGARQRSTCLFVRRTPHKLVFPRCAAVVHHCGAGTTHTTLRAGAPSVPVPHVSDQFAWAEELQRLGAAPKLLRRTKLDAAKHWRHASREVIGNPQMKQAAMAMSARMQSR